MSFGYHISLDKIEILQSNKPTCIQIFTKNPRTYYQPHLSPNLKYVNNKDRIVVVHSAYPINVSRSIKSHPKFNLNMKGIIKDLKWINKNNILGYVIHIDVMSNSNDITKSFLRLNQLGLKYNCFIFIEFSVRINYTIEQYYKFLRNNKKKFTNIKYCIDTAHLWALGYDFNDKSITNKIIQKDVVGFVHFNNSKVNLGSKKDLHGNYSNGKIDNEKLYYVFEKCLELNIPCITENKPPYEDYEKMKEFAKNYFFNK